jgi:hypothetical protein
VNQPEAFAGVAICLTLLNFWGQARVLDIRRRITGCTHTNTYISQMPPQYGEALTFHCQDCGYQVPLRQLHRMPGGLYRYTLPGQDPHDAPAGPATGADAGQDGSTHTDTLPSE